VSEFVVARTPTWKKLALSVSLTHLTAPHSLTHSLTRSFVRLSLFTFCFLLFSFFKFQKRPSAAASGVFPPLRNYSNLAKPAKFTEQSLRCTLAGGDDSMIRQWLTVNAAVSQSMTASDMEDGPVHTHSMVFP